MPTYLMANTMVEHLLHAYHYLQKIAFLLDTCLTQVVKMVDHIIDRLSSYLPAMPDATSLVKLFINFCLKLRAKITNHLSNYTSAELQETTSVLVTILVASSILFHIRFAILNHPQHIPHRIKYRPRQLASNLAALHDDHRSNDCAEQHEDLRIKQENGTQTIPFTPYHQIDSLNPLNRPDWSLARYLIPRGSTWARSYLEAFRRAVCKDQAQAIHLSFRMVRKDLQAGVLVLASDNVSRYRDHHLMC